MEITGTEPKRLTFHSADDIVTQFAPTGKSIVFNSYREYRRYVTWSIPVAGGEPEILCSLESVHGKLSPDASTFVYQKGFGGGYRMGYRGPSATNIWLIDLPSLQVRALTKNQWNDRDPEWSPDGKSIYYISEKDGPQNIYRQDIDSSESIALTQLESGFVSDLTISTDGKRLYFCRDAVSHHHARRITIQAIPITAPADRHSVSEDLLTFSTCNDFALSPDERQIALVYRGDIFALDPEGGKTRPLAETPWRESVPVWHPVDGSLYYIGDRSGKGEIYTADHR